MRKFDINTPEAKRKFQFDKMKHTSSWKQYLNCYNYALQKIFSKGFQNPYAFDCRGRAILFLIRHSFELCLKHNLEANGKHVENTHVFEYLVPAFGDTKIIPVEFLKVLKKFDFSSDGACYRYYSDSNTGEPYFNIDNVVELATVLKDYSEIPKTEVFYLDEICEKFDYGSRKIQWDLTLHIGVSNNLGQIRSEYDNVIEYLVDGVLHDEYDINRIYLPLLFLIRHSIELAWKSNLLRAKRDFPDIIQDIDSESIHSIFKLYKYFSDENGFLSQVDMSKLSDETKKQYEYYKEEYKLLNTAINQADGNSRYFRFPVDGKGNHHPLYMKGDGLHNILRLYYKTDPFLSYTIEVLKEEGIT